MALTKAYYSSDTPWGLTAATGAGGAEKSIPFPRYFLIKSEYCLKVMYPSLSVSSYLKMKIRSSFTGLNLMK